MAGEAPAQRDRTPCAPRLTPRSPHGDHARGDHARGDHARGDHARDDDGRADRVATACRPASPGAKETDFPALVSHPLQSSLLSPLVSENAVSVHLTDLQLAIVRVLWTRGATTVVEVQEALMPERPLAHTTVATLLSRLEKRGVISRAIVGRQFHYRAEVSEPDVRRSMVGELTDMLFAGRPAALISHLIAEQEIRPGDLDEVKQLIAAAERRVAPNGR